MTKDTFTAGVDAGEPLDKKKDTIILKICSSFITTGVYR